MLAILKQYGISTVALILAVVAIILSSTSSAKRSTLLAGGGSGGRTDFKGKIREVCAAAGNPDVCIANGDQVYDICIPCVDNPSGLDGTGVSCTETGDIPMPQGLAGFEGKVSCNDLISKLN